MSASRSTKQRDIITKVLEQAEGPLSVAEVLTRAQEQLPQLGVATVYRTLKLLSELRRIHPVTIEGETRYEFSGRGHHHHFSCNCCGRVFTVFNCPLSLPKGTIFPGGFVVEAHEITLYGTCPECASGTTSK